MSEFTAINESTRVPGLGRKRVRIRAALVLNIVPDVVGLAAVAALNTYP